MKNRYECLLILDAEGKEEGVAEMIDRLKTEFADEGAEVEQVQRMEKRKFSYAAGHLAGGYYVNFIFQAEPAAIDKLRERLKFDQDVYRQHYQKLAPERETQAAETSGD